jgi:parallel beta-helix repeat protein
MNARTLSRVVLLLAAALLSASSAPATTYVVKPDGTGDFPTIQAAIDACVNGDVVELTDGTFTGDGNRDISYLGQAITVRSQSGNPETCIIDSEGTLAESHRGFNFDMNEGPDSRLEGITVMNGWVTESGGAVLCDHVTATFTNCVFSGNTAGMSGGAAYLFGGAPTFTNCDFTRNWATDSGGGVWCRHGAATFTSCAFDGNTASDGGGGAWSWSSTNTFTGCTFSGNSATGSGDLWLRGCDNAVIDNCTFYGAVGGSVGLSYSASIMENTIIAFSIQGSAVVCDERSTIALTCCDIYGNAGGDWVGCIANQYGINGNIGEDPLFCNPNGGDLALHENSPCAPVNSGGCGLIGALPVGCGTTAFEPATWGAIKASFK